MEYDMQEFLESAVRKSEKIAQPLVAVKHSQGKGSKLLPIRSAMTPFVPDDHRESPAGAPGSGKVIKCTWCGEAVPYKPQNVFDSG